MFRLTQTCLSLALFLTAFAGCAGNRPASETTQIDTDTSELLTLYEQGNFFKLRDRLSSRQYPHTAKVLFLQAAVEHAFNEPEGSNRLLDEALKTNAPVPASLQAEALAMKANNLLRLYRYKEAYDIIHRMLDAPWIKKQSDNLAEGKETAVMLEALAAFPPQTVVERDPTAIHVTRDKVGLQRIPVHINGHKQRFVLDTGAGLSVLTHSMAETLGLEIMKVPGFEAHSPTGSVKAGLALAKSLTLGGIVYHNVVFMVFPDKATNFPRIDYSIPGIIGFPVMEAAGALHYHHDGMLTIPSTPSARGLHNLALDGLIPKVRVGLTLPARNGQSLKTELVCTLDTGANQTILFAPFYHRHAALIQHLGQPGSAGIGGAGGADKFAVYRLPKVQLRIGDATVRLENVTVQTDSDTERADKLPDCRIGQDVFGQFNEMIVNFRSMSFRLKGRLPQHS